MVVAFGFFLVLASLAAQMLDAPVPANAMTARIAAIADTGAWGGYAGDDACRSCHQAQFSTYRSSAHHLTSRRAGKDSIDGKFSPGSNILRTSNPYLHFVMSENPEGYFQSAIALFSPLEMISRTERFDIVIGSGRKGQTYLSWKNGELFELPVSYWTETGQWINSPGYPDGLPNFDKPIIPRCLECHTTYIQPLPPPLNRFDRTSMVPGISCERCHGPGRTHIERNRSSTPPRTRGAEAIVNPASMSRERQMDLCALCHAGPGTPKEPSFSFVPGDVLTKYVDIPKDSADAPVEVHAHQVQMLERSLCFRSSEMTCTTCHEVHQTQRNAASFSVHCLTCHRVESCGEFSTRGSRISQDCVNCHMPLQRSAQIVFDADGQRIKPGVRSHRIAIYAVDNK